MTGGWRFRGLVAGTLGLAAICLGGVSLLAMALEGQDATGATVSIEPDSVRVGEPFTLGITLIRQSPGEIQFPALIELPEEAEQRGPVQIQTTREGVEWRAEYTVVAWRADTLAIPPLELMVGAGQGRPLAVELPVVVVQSLLPSETADLELREARPFLRIRGFPWWLIALALLLAALTWWFLRRGREPEQGLIAVGPGARALGEFERLRAAWIGGKVSSDGFYDDYESTLRRYARATRGWSPARDLFGLGGKDGPLFSALRHSVLARFARVGAASERPITDIDVGEAYVRSEMPPEDPEALEESA